MRAVQGLLPRLASVRCWALWRNPRWLAVFVVMVVAADLGAGSFAASVTPVRLHDLWLFALLMGCTAASVELSRKAGEKADAAKDVHSVWELPVAFLLPPLYAILAPISRVALLQWRVRRAPIHRRVFTAASVGLSLGAASLIYHTLYGFVSEVHGGYVARGAAWLLLGSVCALVQVAVNKTVIMTAVKGGDPNVRIRTEVFRREPLYHDLAEMCIGVLVAYGVAMNPLLAPVALPAVTLLQRSVRHAQLLNESRADSKTGLLNAATWEREAVAEVNRAARTGSAAAVALLDLDRFKLINDTYGHLVGDQVLKDVAAALSDALREYDLAGRFGGEEFVVLLPQTKAVDAFRIAERLREHIAKLAVLSPDASARVPVTVSIGVAAMDAGSQRELTELMAAADAALYRAKASGRNQVQMISTSRGLSALRSTAEPDQPAEAVEDPAAAGEAVADSVAEGAAVADEVAAGDAAVGDEAARLSTASISELPEWHSEALPVRSTSGVG